MRNIYHALLLLIAGATQRELAKQVMYLKVEVKFLRGKLPARVAFIAQERNRLVRFGSKLKDAGSTRLDRPSRHAAAMDSRIPKDEETPARKGWPPTNGRIDPQADHQVG